MAWALIAYEQKLFCNHRNGDVISTFKIAPTIPKKHTENGWKTHDLVV
jgi:hypothetical protein